MTDQKALDSIHAYIGILANVAGLGSMQTAEEAARVARWVFGGCVPFALLALVAMALLVSRRK